MPIAEIRLVEGVHYARDAFAAGLSELGFDPCWRSKLEPYPDDVLVLWNRYERDEARAQAYERAGATVLVTENAWLGPEEKDRHLFALCRGHHNGAGTWQVGAHDRWADLGIPISAWRSTGDHVLVLPQRGMGEPGVRQPKGWLHYTLARLQHATTRPIVVRHHPGPRPHPPIDFSNCWAVVTWASGAAVKALIAGVPVFYGLPGWIGATAAVRGFDNIERPFLGDRLPMLRQLAWAMWSREEIAKGEPFRWLLSTWPSMSTESFDPARKSALISRTASSVAGIVPS